MLHQIKAPQFYTDLGLQKTVLNPLANGKIQGIFKAFECLSSTFQGKFYFQGLFKTVPFIQVLLKHVGTLSRNNKVSPVKLEPGTSLSKVEHSATEPLCSSTIINVSLKVWHGS